MSDSVKEITEADFQSEVLETSNSKPVLVDFWGPGCGPCMMMAPVLDKIATAQGEASKIVKVNVSENMGLAQQFGIRGVPTFVYFKDGAEAEKVVGMQPEAKIVSKLEELSL
ncbi:MAG: thioredoxin 1 [Verrucomicrobiales bacterium]|jgi:thioredoxin 1